jgi:hypothetical protein
MCSFACAGSRATPRQQQAMSSPASQHAAEHDVANTRRIDRVVRVRLWHPQSLSLPGSARWQTTGHRSCRSRRMPCSWKVEWPTGPPVCVLRVVVRSSTSVLSLRLSPWNEPCGSCCTCVDRTAGHRGRIGDRVGHAGDAVTLLSRRGTAALLLMSTVRPSTNVYRAADQARWQWLQPWCRYRRRSTSADHRQAGAPDGSRRIGDLDGCAEYCRCRDSCSSASCRRRGRARRAWLHVVDGGTGVHGIVFVNGDR